MENINILHYKVKFLILIFAKVTIFKNVFAEGFPPCFTRIQRTLILQLQASCFPGSSMCIQLGEELSIYVTGTVTEHISHTQQNSVYWPWLKFSFPHFLCQVTPRELRPRTGLYAVTSTSGAIVWKPLPYGFSTTGLHLFYVLARPQKASQCMAKETMVKCFKALKTPSFTISEEACEHLSTN